MDCSKAPVLQYIYGKQQTRADDLPRLDPEDAQAKQLDYVHDAAEARDHEKYKEGAHCANCQQWTGGDAEWGGCNIFPDNTVNRNVWCNTWVERS